MTTRNIGTGTLSVTSGDASWAVTARETVESQWYASAVCISAHWCKYLLFSPLHEVPVYFLLWCYKINEITAVFMSYLTC